MYLFTSFLYFIIFPAILCVMFMRQRSVVLYGGGKQQECRIRGVRQPGQTCVAPNAASTVFYARCSHQTDSLLSLNLRFFLFIFVWLIFPLSWGLVLAQLRFGYPAIKLLCSRNYNIFWVCNNFLIILFVWFMSLIVNVHLAPVSSVHSQVQKCWMHPHVLPPANYKSKAASKLFWLIAHSIHN